MNETNDQVVMESSNTHEQIDHAQTLSQEDKAKKSALIEALASQLDSFEDATMVQLNNQIYGQRNIEETNMKKDGFEILEIANTDPSPYDESTSHHLTTPMKCTQSDSKINGARDMNLKMGDLDRIQVHNDNSCNEPINLEDQEVASLKSLEISNISNNKDDEEKSKGNMRILSIYEQLKLSNHLYTNYIITLILL